MKRRALTFGWADFLFLSLAAWTVVECLIAWFRGEDIPARTGFIYSSIAILVWFYWRIEEQAGGDT